MSLTAVFVITAVLYLIGLFGDSYYGFLEPLRNYTVTRYLIAGYETVFGSTRNGIFFGLLFVTMGALFAKKRIVLNRAVAIIGFVLSEAAVFAECYLLKKFTQPKDYNMFLFLVPAVFFLFYLASHANLKNKPVYASLRAIGVIVYFGHMFVDFFVQLAGKWIGKVFSVDLTPFRLLAVLVITTLLAMLIVRLSKNERFYWLKYLYS